MIARSPSRTTAYQNCTVQPSQCHCTPGSAVTFPFQSSLSSSLCAFLSGKGLNILYHKLFGDNVLFGTLYLSENSLMASILTCPKGQAEFWQNTIGEFSIFTLWVRELP